jgi:4-amino-4-deoxy-L-arabinose transferase-like glycosyltransferase
MSDLYGVIVLDLACLLAAVSMLRAWRRRRTRPPLVAAAFIVVLAALASALVLGLAINYRLVVGSTLIIALLVLLHTARHERRLEADGGADPLSLRRPPAR